MNLNIKQLECCIRKRLHSKRFVCITEASEKTIRFRLVYPSNYYNPIGSGSVALYKGGTISLSTEFDLNKKPKEIQQPELLKELQNFYKNTTRKSLGLPVDK